MRIKGPSGPFFLPKEFVCKYNMQNQSHKYFKISDLNIPHFDYEEYGINGVGNKCLPIISMDKYIDHSLDDTLHIECCKGLAISNNYKMGMVYGAMPPEESVRFDGKNCWTVMLNQLEQYDPTGKHRVAIEEIINTVTKEDRITAVYKYCYFALGSVIPWFYALYLKKSNFFDKTKDTGVLTEDAKLFPNLLEYLETLPFKTIGRVLFFTTYPNAGVATHRDSIVAEHKDHNINLFFSGGWRPSYIWDEITKEKVYLEQNARSYFFNNRDYHGVDPEPIFRYTLRVDGTFTDDLTEELGLEDGHTWKWSYKK